MWGLYSETFIHHYSILLIVQTAQHYRMAMRSDCIHRPMEEVGGGASNSESSDSEDGGGSQRQEMTEERRAKLREIEVGGVFSDRNAGSLVHRPSQTQAMSSSRQV